MAHQNKAPPQQQPRPQPQQQQQQPVSTIPILHSIAPAIFTWITDEDLLAPFTPPTDPVDLLKARLREIEAHAEEVRANLLSLFRRECLRIIQEAEAQEAAAEGEDGDNTTVSLAPLVSQQEVDDMISNMRRNTSEARDRSRSRVLIQNDIFGQPNMNVLPMRNPREAAVAQIQAVISQGLCDLESYKTKVDELRQQIKSEIDRGTRRQGTDRMDLSF